MHQVRVRASARADIRRIMDFIARDRPRAAIRFFEAVKKLAERLTRFPELGAVYECDAKDFEDLRVFPVPRFKRFLMFYRIEGEVIDILRVIHGARDLPSVLEGES